MQVQSLGREDPLEEEMGTCSSILAWKIPWTEESGGLQSMGSQRVRHDGAQHRGAQPVRTTLFSTFLLRCNIQVKICFELSENTLLQ